MCFKNHSFQKNTSKEKNVVLTEKFVSKCDFKCTFPLEIWLLEKKLLLKIWFLKKLPSSRTDSLKKNYFQNLTRKNSFLEVWQDVISFFSKTDTRWKIFNSISDQTKNINSKSDRLRLFLFKSGFLVVFQFLVIKWLLYKKDCRGLQLVSAW